MTLIDAIEKFIKERRALGRLNSPSSVRSYYRTLELHVEDALKRDHRLLGETDRDDVIETMDRWEHANTKRTRRATLVSFYDWSVLTQQRHDNPARQTEGPRRVKSDLFIPTVDEMQRVLRVARSYRDQDWWAMELLAGTGVRNAELRGLRVRDLERIKFVHVPREIAKNKKARSIPAPASVQAVARQALAERHPDDFVIGARQVVDLRNLEGPRPVDRESGRIATVRFDPTQPMSRQSLMRLVQKMVGEARAPSKITPQTIRHFVGSRATTLGSIYLAQAILGHESIATTVEHYVGIATEEETEQIRTAFSIDLGWPEDPPAAMAA